uniref:Predicted protein n=1 Tax=Hordeum vulgare subsp. vulgare TaxID=112509 RepID=F2D7Y5_HORVV|nr:predicted protein [Hordeum vulgare subsp. vulgare]
MHVVHISECVDKTLLGHHILCLLWMVLEMELENLNLIFLHLLYLLKVFRICPRYRSMDIEGISCFNKSGRAFSVFRSNKGFPSG